MATSLGGADFNFRLVVPERRSSVGMQSAVLPFDHVFSFVQRYEQGTGASKVNAVYSAPPTALSGATDIDLRGSLVNVLDGTTVSFPILMGVFVINHSTTSGEYVTIGGSTNPFISWLAASGDGIKVGPSGFKALWSPIDGYGTSAGTADILTLTPATGTPSVSTLLVGRSA